MLGLMDNRGVENSQGGISIHLQYWALIDDLVTFEQ